MFQICTITNSLTQYTEMKASLIQAGFTEDKCRYNVFDNSAENRHDPYRTISEVLAEAAEPYVIFCHQDILLDKGHGFEQLVSQLDCLSRLDPQWAIAGNAGCMADSSLISRITDPNGEQIYGTAPQPVCSLDENFLVIRTAARLHCSESLSGFHLYGTDLCLQAIQHGLTAYVINFHTTHLSSGNAQSADFKTALRRFRQQWNRSFLVCLIKTPCTSFTLSRSQLVRRLLWSVPESTWDKRCMKLYARIVRLKKWAQRGYLRPRRTASL